MKHHRALLLAQTLLLASLVPAQSPAFEPGDYLPVISNGVALRAADRDGDGDVDLIGSSVFGALVGLDGDGLLGFATASAPAVNGGPRAWWIDFDADGDQDLFVTANQSSAGNVRQLYRNDAGTWTAVPTPAGASYATNCAVHDFDGDGDLDLLTTSGDAVQPGPPEDQLLVNDGAGTFTRLTPFPTSSGHGLAAADFDGDGDVDVVLASTTTELYRNDGGMNFTLVPGALPAGLPGWPASLAAGDFDGDGTVDLVLDSSLPFGTTGAFVCRNDGTGTFTQVPGALQPAAGTWSRTEAVDFDLDGDLDLLRATNWPAPVQLDVNDGTGVFTPAAGAFGAALATGKVTIGDYDRDGDQDLLLWDSGVQARRWINRHRHLRAIGAPTVGQPWTVEVESRAVVATGPRPVLLGLGGARLAAPTPLADLGLLWLDPTAPIDIGTRMLPANGTLASFVVQVPQLPALAGATVHLQAMVFEPAGPQLTSMVSATIQ